MVVMMLMVTRDNGNDYHDCNSDDDEDDGGKGNGDTNGDDDSDDIESLAMTHHQLTSSLI